MGVRPALEVTAAGHHARPAGVLREPRQPVPLARPRSDSGDGGPLGARRISTATRAATGRRESGDLADRRVARAVRGMGAHVCRLRLAPEDFPRLDQIRVDGWFVAVAALAAVTVGTLAGTCRRSMTRVSTSPRRWAGGGRTTGTPGASPAPRLIVLEAASRCCSSLARRCARGAFSRSSSVNAGDHPGRRPDRRCAHLPTTQTDTEGVAARALIVERLRAIPGYGGWRRKHGAVRPHAVALRVHTARGHDRGRPPLTATARPAVVTPGYAEAVGMRLREGRFFTSADTTPRSAHPGERHVSRRRIS